MKKILSIVLGISLLLSNVFVFAGKARADSPTLAVDLTAKKYAVGTSYSDSTSVATGDVVVFLVTVTNTAVGTTAQNTTVQAVFPTTYSTNHTVTFNVTSTNAPSASDTTAVTFTDTTGKLELKPNTTLLTWNNGTTTVINGIAPDQIVTPGMNFGDLIDGSSHAITLVFQANGVAGANPTSTPAPTATPSSDSPSGSSSSPSQPQSCNDTKPEKAVVTGVHRVSPTSVKLSWSKADGANNYAISYGTGSKSYQYGVDRTSDVTDYVINDLDPATNYYFAVVSINGCTSGEISNELFVNPSFVAQVKAEGAGQTTKSQLGTSSAIDSEEPEAKKESKPAGAQKNQTAQQKVLGFLTQKKVAAGILTLAVIAFIAQNLLKKPVQTNNRKVKTMREKTVSETSSKKRKK
ncbi:MAG: hypothetical protein A3F31_00160 [Candidatus Levybacteria bacterium RIFCSPHIGHO2_12_FULL_38_12]|nr:MAG: hypothetical protein A3F31_00160 [Candidatus Levybacteria bacterium RIFCSPHIGHO2_12_FULL_38_12]